MAGAQNVCEIKQRADHKLGFLRRVLPSQNCWAPSMASPRRARRRMWARSRMRFKSINKAPLCSTDALPDNFTVERLNRLQGK